MWTIDNFNHINARLFIREAPDWPRVSFLYLQQQKNLKLTTKRCRTKRLRGFFHGFPNVTTS